MATTQKKDEIPRTEYFETQPQKKGDKNKELMLAAGSKNGAYDAEAPDQWRYLLRHATDPLEKAMAWVKSKTTAFRHESPFCVDEHGQALVADHMAVELGWKLQTARNVLTQLQAQGRIRLQKGKRIWYCADIPKAYEEPAEDAQNGDSKSSTQSIWGSYVVDFIRSLPEEQRPGAETKLQACEEWKREFLAEGMAALRTIIERVEDTTLAEIGVPKRRLPKRRVPESNWVQLSLLAEPNFVQSTAADSVQNGNAGSYKAENGLYKPQTAEPSLYASTTTTAPAGSSTFSHHHQHSSLPEQEKRITHSKNGDDDEKNKAGKEYANGREHLKAIYLAKSGDHAPIDFLERIESILVSQGKSFEDFVSALATRQHLPNPWKNPAGLLTNLARSIFRPPTSPPQEKPKPKCPVCFADDRRGAILQDGAIVPCPKCSTPEWIAELARKIRPKTTETTG